MTNEQILKAITNYPIPSNVIGKACLSTGLVPTDEATSESLKSLEYLKTERHVIAFLLIAPTSISEQGVSFSVSSDEKAELRKRLSSLNSEIDAAEIAAGVTPEKTRPNVAFDAY